MTTVAYFATALFVAAALWKALEAILRAFRRLQNVQVAVQELNGERDDRERELAILREEYDARVKRLSAREAYWRKVATDTAAPDAHESTGNSESPLEMRRRLRGA